MLPTLYPTALPPAPNSVENGQILADLLAAADEISFASLLPAGVNAVADPAISGKPAVPTGKPLPLSPAIIAREAPVEDGEAVEVLPEIPVAAVRMPAVAADTAAPIAPNRVVAANPVTAERDPTLASNHPKPWLNADAENITRLRDGGARFVAPMPPVATAAPQVGPVSRVDVSSLSAAIEAILPGKPSDGADKLPKVPVEVLTDNLPGKETAAKTQPVPVTPIRSVPSAESNSANLPRLSVKFIEKDTQGRTPDPRPAVVATKPEQTEKPISAPQTSSASPVPAQQPAPSLVLAPQATPNAVPVASQTAPQSAEQPRDFGALIDRLVQARDASVPASAASVRAVMSHTDFGSVTVRFDQSGVNLAAHVSSQDPAFAPAARAALAAEAGPRSDDHQRGQPSGGTGQSGANTPESQTNLQSGSQSRAGSQDRGDQSSRGAARSGADLGGEPRAENRQSNDTQAAQRGLYI